jgi:mannose-1-phosphate guanylyltransferase
MARAMVLCAGLGTRLRPLTDELPKPLVPVGDRPILAHIAGRLRANGMREAVINTHHLADKFKPHINRLAVRIHSTHELEIRGTAGGVAAARQLLGPPPVLIHNGDTLAEPPLGELLGSCSDGLCLAVTRRAAGQGSVGLDAEGNVVRLRGQQFGSEASGGDYIGVAALGRRCLASLPEPGCLIGDWALPELRQGGRISTVRASSAWTDAGDPARYLRANLLWLADHANAERGCWVGPGAHIEDGVELEQCLLGANSRVRGRGWLRRCVLWPAAEAQVPLDNAIVTSAGQLVVVNLAYGAKNSSDCTGLSSVRRPPTSATCPVDTRSALAPRRVSRSATVSVCSPRIRTAWVAPPGSSPMASTS